MLDPAGARGPVANTPDPRPNPLPELPTGPAEVVDGVDAVLVTHLHSDHLDETATGLLRERRLPIACRPGDEPALHERGLSDLRPVAQAIDLCGVGIARTPGRHGTGEIGRKMGPRGPQPLRARPRRPARRRRRGVGDRVRIAADGETLRS
jgi:hypothetical protein